MSSSPSEQPQDHADTARVLARMADARTMHEALGLVQALERTSTARAGGSLVDVGRATGHAPVCVARELLHLVFPAHAPRGVDGPRRGRRTSLALAPEPAPPTRTGGEHPGVGPRASPGRRGRVPAPPAQLTPHRGDTVTEPSPVVDPSTTLQVPAPAALVVAPTPQDRALQVPRPAALVVSPTPQDRALLAAGHSSCGCPPAVLAVAGHLDGCPGRATP